MGLATTLIAGLATMVGLGSAFTNPIRRPSGGDPFVTYSDGYYYLMTTSLVDVEIARSETLEGLKSAPKTVIYSDSDPSRCCNVWAPEVHNFDGVWYAYYTAGNGDNLDGQRLHVLKGGATPLDAFTYAGQLTTEWSIDGSILRMGSWGDYLMSSCTQGVPSQSICLQQLGADRVSVTGPIHIISQPTESWEVEGMPVNEGPFALYFGGKTYISYSASYCWTAGYCLGLLAYDGVSDPTAASAWTKSNGCELSSGNGHYGTGHNSFFQSPDTTQTWVAYHATDNSAGTCDDSRYTMIQLLGTRSDGTPDFGTPVVFSLDAPEPSGER
ncbi:putative glycosyl family 43 [Rosellinia necatrix]|uniref:Putative glycosyl family 43 n=1 Tax=Rosellinia necatrix TaxID=77044 RepID=A0A1W2TMC2_ROSNE|nr:putative glycosyl family 43 [Rosellinia necatrix]